MIMQIRIPPLHDIASNTIWLQQSNLNSEKYSLSSKISTNPI